MAFSIFRRSITLGLILASCLALVGARATGFELQRRLVTQPGAAGALDARSEEDKSRTPLPIHTDEFKSHCEKQWVQGWEPDRSCFTFLSGDLKDVSARVWMERCKDVEYTNEEEFLVKDETMKDFTFADKAKSFEMMFRGTHGCTMKFTQLHEKGDQCYLIELSTFAHNDKWRISISKFPDADDAWILDTKNGPYTKGTFCSNWFRINVDRNGKNH